MTKTIKLSDYFGEKEYTLEEFKKRWSSPTNEIWSFLIDHGDKEEREFGQKLAEEIFPKVVTVCGGIHPTLYPECIKEAPSLDVIFRGDSEVPFLNFLQKIM